MISKSLGDIIRERRAERDFSLRELAKRVGVSAPFMSDVELGRRFPKDEVLGKIAAEIGMTFKELKQFDNRKSISDIKHMMRTSPELSFVFRTAAERIKSGKLTPEQLLDKLQEGNDEGNAKPDMTNLPSGAGMMPEQQTDIGIEYPLSAEEMLHFLEEEALDLCTCESGDDYHWEVVSKWMDKPTRRIRGAGKTIKDAILCAHFDPQDSTEGT